MKELLIIITILLLGSFCNAQQYIHIPDSNAMWTEVSSSTFHCYVLLNKDTIINSKKYHKVYRSNDTIINESDYCGGIREDSSKRVYFYGNEMSSHFNYPGVNWYNRDVILYDFSVKPGDTLRNRSTDTVSYKYNFFDDWYMVVSSIDSIFISGKNRKMINFVPYNPNVWIEGIGNIRGLLFWDGPIPIGGGGLSNVLICLKQNGNWVYHIDSIGDCFQYLYGIKENKKDNGGVLFYPNPVSDVSYLRFDKKIHSFESIEIVSITGEKKMVNLIKSQTMFSVYKKDFSEGIYLYRLIAKDGYMVTGKFIID